MRTWETLREIYEHEGWSSSAVTVKTEPQDRNLYTTSTSAPVSSTQSNPESPQSMDSEISSPNASLYSERIHGRSNLHAQNVQRPFGYNPLTPPTPPGYPNPNIPSANIGLSQSQSNSVERNPSMPYQNGTSLTPSHTPPMDDTPPNLDATPERDIDNASISEDCRSVESYCEDIRTPKVNSHGKVKMFKCKQCEFIAVTKVSFWEHIKIHIKVEKLLKCPKCPFVSEYKHHLEYHLKNHDGSKPFQCHMCNYTCVNKSMLNSHLKSHSSVYQYHCANCEYATKYCHSLKIHLRKFEHKPGVVLNQDGSPNPLPIIDVYGTRRGPKNRSNDKQRREQMKESPSPSQQSQQSIATMQQQTLSHQQQKHQEIQQQQQQTLQHLEQQKYQQQQQQLQNLIPSMMSNPFNMFHFPYLNLNIQMLAAQQQAALAHVSPRMDDSKSVCSNDDREENINDNHEEHEYEDVQMNEQNNNGRTDINESECSSDNNPSTNFNEESAQSHHSTPSSSKNRRKGSAFKLDISKDDSDSDADDDDDEATPSKRPLLNTDLSTIQVTKNVQSPTSSVVEKKSKPEASKSFSYECKYCEISFKDEVLHSIHMGYHGYNEVFTCNMCGEKCDGRVSFFLHVARSSHN